MIPCPGVLRAKEVCVYQSMSLPAEPTATAPDGSRVRVLLGSPHGGLAHFEFPSGETAPAVRHKTVDEVWYILSGRGEMWLSDEGRDDVVELRAGTCISIPVGTTFQVRTHRPVSLCAVGATMPPWPGPHEALVVAGRWQPTLAPGEHSAS